jgi:hypothetical protein
MGLSASSPYKNNTAGIGIRARWARRKFVIRDPRWEKSALQKGLNAGIRTGRHCLFSVSYGRFYSLKQGLKIRHSRDAIAARNAQMLRFWTD